MKKFSIIIPVYNVEKYIVKCIDSVFNQTFKDFEVIVVNDGTKDNSIDLIKDYDVKIINQENQGLSAARNNGTKEATGEYIIFLDSDDSWDSELLEKLNESSENKPDLIRFQIRTTYEDKEPVAYEEESFNSKTGPAAFEIISKYNFIECACFYAIKRSFFEKENFQFKVNTAHEDFGLMPLVIMKAKKVNAIKYIGYNYFQRTGSIMNNNNYQKTQKKARDMYNHYNYLMTEIDKTDLEKSVFKSFIANSIIEKACDLKGKDYKKYVKKLKEDKVFDNVLSDTFKRKLKKFVIKISPKLYFKLLRK